MDRLRRSALTCALLVGLASDGRAAPPEGRTIALGSKATGLTILVDRDDDDGDGLADFESAKPSRDSLGDVVWITTSARRLDRADGSGVRLIIDGKPIMPQSAVGRRLTRIGLQGIGAGVTRLSLGGVDVEVKVLDLLALDGLGERVDFASSHAALSRSLPVDATDLEALSFVVAGAPDTLPRWLSLGSFRPDATPLDSLGEVTLEPRPCPAGLGPELQCRATAPIRSVGDAADRSHPGASLHSLLAEVGGRLLVGIDAANTALRVGGPRKSAVGPLERLRGKLRLRLVRMSAGGAPPVGGDDAGAIAVARRELATANSLWGQCGVVFGSEAELDVAVVDPPGPYLVAVGCDLGTPASGGEVTLVVDDREVRVPTKSGQSPTVVAGLLARALRRAGFRPVVAANALASPTALRSVDLIVRRKNGNPARVALPTPRSTTDATLRVCIGAVDLSDGLSHFSDFDAVAGTLEERTLLRAFDDGDPTTIEVLVVPSFSRAGRIGESFIFGEGAGVRNAVIVDRAGVRAGARSFALAHELGHILLDLPGHPDDFGVDRPSLLMDADATDASVFGPRRLTLADCERAVRQSGPKAPVPLLRAWPLTSRAPGR